MQNSILKLAVVGGVVGIGCLALFQVQNSLWRSSEQSGNEAASTDDAGSGEPTDPGAQPQLGFAADPDSVSFDASAAQRTAEAGDDSTAFPNLADHQHSSEPFGGHEHGGTPSPFDAGDAGSDHRTPYGKEADEEGVLADDRSGPRGDPRTDSNLQPSGPGLDFRADDPQSGDTPGRDDARPVAGTPASGDADPFAPADPFAAGGNSGTPARDGQPPASTSRDQHESSPPEQLIPYVRNEPQDDRGDTDGVINAEATQTDNEHGRSGVQVTGDAEESPFDNEAFPWDEPESDVDPDAEMPVDVPGPPEFQTAPQPGAPPAGPQLKDDRRSDPDDLLFDSEEASQPGDAEPERSPFPLLDADEGTETDSDGSFNPEPDAIDAANDRPNQPWPQLELDPDDEPAGEPADEGPDPTQYDFDEDPFGGSPEHDRPAPRSPVEIAPDEPADPGPAMEILPAPNHEDEPSAPQLGPFNKEQGGQEPTPRRRPTADPADTAPKLLPWDEPGQDRSDDEMDDRTPAAEDEPPHLEPGEPLDETTEPDLFDDGDTNGTDRPKPLGPVPDATQITPQPPLDLRGDGTVAPNDPRGPQTPQLSVEKSAPANAVLGQPLIYSIFVRNVGNSPAHQVVVQDRIPKGTQLKGTIPQAEMAGKRLIWKLGTLNPGEHKKISIRVVPFSPGRVGSVATVNFVSEVASQTLVTTPKLKIDVRGPEEAKLGEIVLLEFQVTNSGNGEARGVVIRDLVPDGLTHPGGKDLEYEVGQLAAGESREIKLQLTAAKVGETVNHTIVTAAGGITAEAKTPLEIYGSKLDLARTGPKRRYVGRPAVYSNLLTNASDRPVEGVAVIEKIPAGMEFVEASSGGQYNQATRTVAWRIGQLEPRGKRVLRIKLLPRQTGALVSDVKAIAEGGTSVDVSSQTEVAGFAAIGVEIPTVASPVDVGETVTFRVAAQNRGTVAARNVAVQVDVPNEMELLSARGPSQHAQSGNQIRFAPISSVDAKTRATFEITLRARSQGDARIRVHVNAEHLSQPLTREEAILVLGEAPPGSGPGTTAAGSGTR